MIELKKLISEKIKKRDSLNADIKVMLRLLKTEIRESRKKEEITIENKIEEKKDINKIMKDSVQVWINDNSSFYFTNPFIPSAHFGNIVLLYDAVVEKLKTGKEFDHNFILEIIPTLYNKENNNFFEFKADDTRGFIDISKISSRIKKPLHIITDACRDLKINVSSYQKTNSNKPIIGKKIKLADSKKVIDFIINYNAVCSICGSIYVKKNKKNTVCSDKCLERKKLEKMIDCESTKCLKNMASKVYEMDEQSLITEFGSLE